MTSGELGRFATTFAASTALAVLAVLVVLGPSACGAPPPAPPPLSLWHTFGPEETEALNQALAELRRHGGPRAVASLVPFGRARARLLHALADGRECPDLARVDATWLPQLAALGLLRPVHDPALAEGFLDEALELGRWQGTLYGLPQAVDGLALLYDRRQVPGPITPWPPASLEHLEAAAQALTRPGRAGLSLRADAYWFVAWLRASGGDVLDPETRAVHIDEPAAQLALRRYVGLVSAGAAAPPNLAGDEAALEAEALASGRVALVVGGPWTVAAVRAAARRRGSDIELEVAPFPSDPQGRPAAPRGGQLWVVPTCSASPERAFALARELTEPTLQAAWSQILGLVPTRAAALERIGPLGRAFARALEHTRPLPRHPLTPLIFDDLTPAIAAALAGDASVAEVLAGVARAWRRLLDHADRPGGP